MAASMVVVSSQSIWLGCSSVLLKVLWSGLLYWLATFGFLEGDGHWRHWYVLGSKVLEADLTRSWILFAEPPRSTKGLLVVAAPSPARPCIDSSLSIPASINNAS